MTPDASLFRWRKDNVQGETSDLVTDRDVVLRAAEIVAKFKTGAYYAPPFLTEHLQWLASRLESEPSTDGDIRP